ncbi:chitinase [Streptomyces sp. NPDC049954]|uniref:chitinase n=1 Tax=Streptomyces sp. NPDC049954 TaxID=3155779 RepID=UPI00342B6B47
MDRAPISPRRPARRRGWKAGALGVAAATALLVTGLGGQAQATGAGASAPAAGARQAASGSAAVPAHAVTGYWQNFDNGASVQTLADVPSDYDIVAVAFADATSTPGAVDFTLDSAGLGGYTEDSFKADVAAKHADGKSVIISVGGERGAVAVNSEASANAFADSVYALMQEYGFDGVDIDLENGLDSTYMSQALRSLSQKAGSGLVVTMAPQTIDMQSTSNEYFKTALDVKDILTVVNMQYYNSGSMLGCDGQVYAQGSVDFLTALACIQLEGGLDPSQVGIGTPASASAAGGGYVSPSVVNDALDCLAKGTGCGSFKPAKTYPGIRGAMTWSTNWDASSGNAWSGAVGPHVHGL